MFKVISRIAFSTLLSTVLLSCSSDTVVDAQSDMFEGAWHIDSLASFDFQIDDTTSLYTLDYSVRYAIDYPYYNLFIRYYLEDSVGVTITSAQQELLLFDKKTGAPLGDGLGDIFDRKIRIFDTQKYAYQGQYTFKVKQFMRTQNLPGILSFGVKVVKEKE